MPSGRRADAAGVLRLAGAGSAMYPLAHVSLKRKLPLQLSSEGAKGTDDDHMTEGVYERIKSWLLTQALVPGQLLQIGVLADELGVSTTPVREALTRLAAERLIIAAPKRGFFARTPSEDDILGLYCVNHTVLDAAVARWRGKLDERLQGRLSPPVAPDADAQHLARRTADLFVQIAARSGISEFAEIVRNMNDRLHHARLVEFELMAGSLEEWATLATIYASGHADELQAALKLYHEKRWQIVSTICKELLLRSFLSAER